MRHVYKEELIATTYFESFLESDINKSSVLRFRQRCKFESRNKKVYYPKFWTLSGSGNLELKFKYKKRNYVTKYGTYLSSKRGSDLYKLFKLIRTTPFPSNKVKAFIDKLNNIQIANYSRNKSAPSLLTFEKLLKVIGHFTPQITRVCLRKTFESIKNPVIKVTLESKPAFYPYPVEHRSNQKNRSYSKYRAQIAEVSKLIKIEFKSKVKDEVLKMDDLIAKQFRNNLLITGSETTTSYPKMIVEASKNYGSMSVENPKNEIEIKANIIGNPDLKKLIKKLWQEFLSKNKSPYNLFITDPLISIRGYGELNRTIIGWKDDKGWHEIVTKIKLNKEGVKENGFETILKWKTDDKSSNNKVLRRKTNYVYMQKDISVSELINLANQKINKKLRIIGILKKIKYRIIIQDVDGRNFVVSLDKTLSLNSLKSLKQLEIEYYHTVLIDHKPGITLEHACHKCYKYITKILLKHGVQVTKTSQRKIDFAGDNNN